MIKISGEEVKRWRVEIEQSEKFRRDHFGTYTDAERTGAGWSIEYFESGFASRTLREFDVEDFRTTINMVFPIVKNVVPSLYFKNPNVLALPKRKEDEQSAPLAAEILNYYHRELNLKEVNQRIIFDAYVLGMGICKIGYATQFGADIPDEKEKKRRDKSRVDKILEGVGIKKPKEEEKPENIEINEFIRAESPYVIWISPFDFLVDPRAKSIHDAMWVCHRVRKTLKEIKDNKNYSNTSSLQPSPLEKTPATRDLDQSQIDNFQTLDVYEIHYKTDKGINIITLAKDQSEFRPLRHEENAYDMDGFQFEILTFNKHAHKFYPVSDIGMIWSMQDRVNVSFDSILDQVDKFVSKIFVDETKMSEQGKRALENGSLGAICYTNANPNEVAKELSMTQLKGDMAALVEKVIDIMSLTVGLTRAQLTGITSAETATEAQIGQSGQNLRLADKADNTVDFVNKQNRKLWQVVSQFVDLEQLQLITGEPVTTPQGQPQYNWLNVDSDRKEELIKGEYRFDIEVGSAQKPDIQVIRQQATNFANMLFNPVVKQLLAMEGTNLNLTEVLRTSLKLFPEWIKNTERILQQATPQQQQQAQIQSQQEAGGENTGAVPNLQRTPPTPTSITEQVFGERRGGT